MKDDPDTRKPGGIGGRVRTVAFEGLHIDQRARDLTNAVYTLTRKPSFAADLALVNQIRRAAISIMSNIAEGFERGTKTEFIQFLFVAKGSCGEVRAQLQIAHDQRYLSDAEHTRLCDLARRTSAMIANFIAHLQQTDYRGSKFTSPSARRARPVDKPPPDSADGRRDHGNTDKTCGRRHE